MQEKAIDRRVRKTKQQLRNGLTELLREKPVKDITVRELSDKVDINRGTFYLHYRDVFDMVEQVENEIFEQFSSIINVELSNDNEVTPLIFFENVFRFFADNADIAAVMLGPNGDLAFVNKLKKLVQDKCIRDWMLIFDTDNSELFELYYAFVVGGVVELFQMWIETGRKQTPEEMANIAKIFIVDGVSALANNVDSSRKPDKQQKNKSTL